MLLPLSFTAGITAVASPIVDTVKTTTGVWNAVGSLGTLFAFLATVITCYIKFGPKWKEIAIGSHKADIQALTDRQTVLETKLDEAMKLVNESKDKAREIESKAEERVHKVELQLRSALNACRVLLNYVEREHSDAPEVTLAKDLLASAIKDSVNMGDEFTRMVWNIS